MSKEPTLKHAVGMSAYATYAFALLFIVWSASNILLGISTSMLSLSLPLLVGQKIWENTAHPSPTSVTATDAKENTPPLEVIPSVTNVEDTTPVRYVSLRGWARTVGMTATEAMTLAKNGMIPGLITVPGNGNTSRGLRHGVPVGTPRITPMRERTENVKVKVEQ